MPAVPRPAVARRQAQPGLPRRAQEAAAAVWELHVPPSHGMPRGCDARARVRQFTHPLPDAHRSARTQARIARMRFPVHGGRLAHRPALHACAARFTGVGSHTGPHCTHALPGSQRSARTHETRKARIEDPQCTHALPGSQRSARTHETRKARIQGPQCTHALPPKP